MICACMRSGPPDLGSSKYGKKSLGQETQIENGTRKNSNGSRILPQKIKQAASAAYDWMIS